MKNNYFSIRGLLRVIEQLALLLKASVTDKNFYVIVYKRYRGYGLKYVFILSFFSSIFFSIVFFKTFYQFTEYNSNWRYVLSQVPNIEYNGAQINTKTEASFLYNKDGNTIALIDVENKFNNKERQKAPIVFTNKNIIVSFSFNPKSDTYLPNAIVPYTVILGNKPQYFDNDRLRNYVVKILGFSRSVFIYITIPLSIVMRFVNILL